MQPAPKAGFFFFLPKFLNRLYRTAQDARTQAGWYSNTPYF